MLKKRHFVALIFLCIFAGEGWRGSVGPDRVKNEEVLRNVVKEERIILRTVMRKATWIGHILRRSCLLKHVIGGKIVVTGR